MNASQKKLIYISVCAAILIAIAILALNRNNNSPGRQTDTPLNITVSIPPLKYIVDRITGGEIPVNVILPPGSGPETYEPTPRSLKELDRSSLVFVTGLIDFENTVARRVAGNRVVRLSEGMDLIDERCTGSHDHSHHGHNHSHGIDPHIWSSPACLKVMASTVFSSLSEKFATHDYTDNYARLIEDLDDLDQYIRDAVETSGVRSFLVYHPALTYYADDYGLQQIQLEFDGKEPSADKLISTLSKASYEGLDKVLYQKEFSVKTVESVAKELGALPVEIDPLDEDVIANLRAITDIITGN